MNSSFKPKKTLVIGARSFIGSHFIRKYRQFRSDILYTDYKADNAAHHFDLLNPDYSRLPLDVGYQYGIIAAATPNIAYCEKWPEETYQNHVVTPLELGRRFCEHGMTPIFFSSDAVFNGNGDILKEDTPHCPVSEYGRQKVLLEESIPQVCSHGYLIFRLSKIYGTVAGDGTLLDEMFQLLLQGDRVRAASDQVFCPVDIDDVIDMLFLAQEHSLRGLFNLCGSEVWSRYKLALQVKKSLKVCSGQVKKMTLDDLPRGSIYSKYTAMSCQKLCNAISFKTRSIQEAIANLSQQYTHMS